MIYDNISTILTSVVRSLYTEGPLSLAHITSFRTADITSLPYFSDIRTLLIQLAVVLSVTFIGVIVYVNAKRRALATATPAADQVESTQTMPIPEAGALGGRWAQVTAHLDSARENDWKQAVLEADKLVDDALARAGFSGDTFGDRLTNIQPGTLISLDGLWWAHRVRNRVAHELDYFLRYTEARQAVSYYESTLAELKLL